MMTQIQRHRARLRNKNLWSLGTSSFLFFLSDHSSLSLSRSFHTQPTTLGVVLISFWLSSDAEVLLINTDWAFVSGPNVQKHVCNVYIFRMSFHFVCRRWWLGTSFPPPSCFSPFCVIGSEEKRFPVTGSSCIPSESSPLPLFLSFFGKWRLTRHVNFLKSGQEEAERERRLLDSLEKETRKGGEVNKDRFGKLDKFFPHFSFFKNVSFAGNFWFFVLCTTFFSGCYMTERQTGQSKKKRSFALMTHTTRHEVSLSSWEPSSTHFHTHIHTHTWYIGVLFNPPHDFSRAGGKGA